MSVTPIEKSVGYRAKAITIKEDGGILAQFEVGTMDGANFRAIAAKNYLLSAEEAAPVLNAETAGGTVHGELTDKLAAVLSQRNDWIV